MINTKYGMFKDSQIALYIKEIQRMIFWCILYTDPNTAVEYPDIDVVVYQKNIMKKIAGFNSFMGYPNEMVNVLVILEAALQILEGKEYSFAEYRKFILDAGAMAGKMKVGDAT